MSRESAGECVSDGPRNRRDRGAPRAKVVLSRKQNFRGSRWRKEMGKSHVLCKRSFYTYLFDSPSILENTDNPRRMRDDEYYSRAAGS